MFLDPLVICWWVQVVDHGIPISVIDAMREACSAFFKSSLEDKNLCANGKEGRIAGYGRVFKGTETSRWDWVDVLTHRVGPLPLTDQDSSAWPSKPASYKWAYTHLFMHWSSRKTFDRNRKELKRSLVLRHAPSPSLKKRNHIAPWGSCRKAYVVVSRITTYLFPALH